MSSDDIKVTTSFRVSCQQCEYLEKADSLDVAHKLAKAHIEAGNLEHTITVRQELLVGKNV